MATNKITVIIDAVVDRADLAVKGFRRSIAEADTAAAKFKAGAGAALTQVKAHAAELAMAGGAALAAFGAKAVSAFQDLALESSKFSDATDMNVEQASRWIEVAGDIGIGVDQIQTAFVRMEKAAATGSGAFRDYNIQIARTSDGQVDVTQTFLNTLTAIQKIPDANKRAEASSAIFGRGYAEIAELINTDAQSILDSLNSVSDAKVIDEAEVEKAKRLRAAMDSLQDTLDDITLLVGEHLVPAVSEGAEKLQQIADRLVQVKEAYDGLPAPIRAAAEAQAKLMSGDPKGAFESLTGAASEAVWTLDEFEGSASELRAELENLGVSESDITRALAAYAKQQDEANEAGEESVGITGMQAESALGFIDVLNRLVPGIREKAEAFLEASAQECAEMEAGAAAAATWAENFNESYRSAAQATLTFRDESKKNLDTYIQDLEFARQQNETFFGHIDAIAAQTSPEFAQHLLSMGVGATDMVAQMRATEGGVQDAFRAYTGFAETMNRDVVAEMKIAGSGGPKALRAEMAGEVKLAVGMAGLQGRQIGEALAKGMKNGIEAESQAAADAAAAAARKVANAARLALGLPPEGAS